MIVSVVFQKPVVFVSVGTDYWSATNSAFNGVTCEDKGNHLRFVTTVKNKRRIIKVPLTNIAQVTEEEDPDEPTPPKKGKAPAEVTP